MNSLLETHNTSDVIPRQGQKFVAVGAELRYLVFTATNRDIWYLPQQITIISLLNRDFCGFPRQIAISFTSYGQIPEILAF
jgi:hypothetical protein